MALFERLAGIFHLPSRVSGVIESSISTTEAMGPPLAEQLFGLPVAEPATPPQSQVKKLLEGRLNAPVPHTMSNRDVARMLELAAHGDPHDEGNLGVNTGITAEATTIVVDCVNSTDEAKILEAYAQTIGISGAPRALAENVIHGKIMRQVNVQAQVVADTLGLNSTPLMTIADTGDGCVVSVLHRVEASGGDTLWEMDPHEAARFAVELAQSLVHDGSNGILQSLCANTAESAFGISPPEVSLQRRVYVGTHPLSLTDPHGNLGIPGSFHAGLTEPMRAADAAKREMTDKGVVIDQATASLIPDTSLLGPMEQIHPRNYPPVHARALHDNGIHCSKSEVVYDCHDMTTFGLVSVPPLDETTSMTVPPFFVSEGGDPNQADVISVDDDPYTTLAGNLLSQPREFTKVFHVSPFRYLDDEPDIMDYLLLERTRNGKNDEKPPISSKLRRIG